MIRNELVFEGKYRVALIEEPGMKSGRNVVGLDSSGKIIWRIDPDPINPSYNYVSISNSNGKLIAVNFSTNQIEVDYRTGKTLSTRWVK